MAEALPIMWRGQRRLPRRDARGLCVSMRSLSIHLEVAALIADAPLHRSESPAARDVTTARCPVCDQTALTVVAEWSSRLLFRCESCGFMWLEDKPQVPDPPSKRADG